MWGASSLGPMCNVVILDEGRVRWEEFVYLRVALSL